MEAELSNYQSQMQTLQSDKSKLSLTVDNLKTMVQQLRKEIEEKDRKYRVNCESAEIDIDYLNSQVGKINKKWSIFNK